MMDDICKHCGRAIYLGTFGEAHWEPDYDPYDDPKVWRHKESGYAACPSLAGFAEPVE